MEIPKGCNTLKVERMTQSGFFWAFEFLNYPDVTKEKQRLHYIEDHMYKKLRKHSFEKNYEERQFVAVVLPGLKRVARGYTLLFTPEKGGLYDVLCIDYGNVVKAPIRDLRDLPEYASVEILPAQSWRIGIYGVLPVHLKFDFGHSASKIVGESWNGKDIQFIENVLKNNDTIDFHEVKKIGEYKFGYIYLQDPNTKKLTTLQKLLVDNAFAVDAEDFDKVIPSIVKRIRSSRDHESFPTGHQTEGNDLVETKEIPAGKTESETPQSKESSYTKPSVSEQLAPMSSESQSPKPKSGKGRGEVIKNLKPMKAPQFEPTVMVGRIPLTSEQFDDSVDSIYYDAESSTKPLDSTRRDSSSSVEFLSPANSVLSLSQHLSSSSLEITTRKTIPEVQTVSLITPPNGSADCVTIDLTTPPPSSPISLITPPSSSPVISLITPSPCGSDGLGKNNSDLSQSSSSSMRRRGRGDLLNSLSRSSDSQSMKSATSNESLTDKLSQLKLETTPVPIPRGRGALISRTLNDPTNLAKLKANDSTETKNIVSPEPVPANSKVDKEKNDSNQFVNDIEEIEYNDHLITKIMVLGNEGVCNFRPRFSINEFDLHPDVKKRAGQLRLVDLVRGQRYMIPAMLTRRNVTLVGPSKGGKTVSCLLALFSLLKNKNFYSGLPVGPGPRAIILCPYSSQCEDIERQCTELNKSAQWNEAPAEKETLRLNVAYGCGKEAEKDKLNELTQGYDIVICTPSCLLRLLQTPEMMNFKRLCHLVLDDADTLFKSYNDEVIEILQKAYSCGKKCENGLVLPQRVIISKEWVPCIKQWIQKDVTEQLGILLMASYSEAAIFANVKATLRRIDDEDRKKNDLLNYLHIEAPEKSTVVVFNNKDDMAEVYSWLKPKCRRPIMKADYTYGGVEDIVIDWKRSSDRNEHPIIFCTDNTLHDLSIYEANSLVHYDLPPEERGYFTERFSVLLERLAGPPDFYTPGKMPLNFSKTETLIYIGPKDHQQFPEVIKLLSKLRMKIPPELQFIAEELLRARELEKDNHKFCENYKKFGFCPDEKLCQSRHYFSEKYDKPADDIPQSGFVKMKILQVYSASHYSVRLLEHRNGTKDKWSLIKSNIHPGVLNVKVNHYYSDHSKRSMHVCKNVGEIAAIETTTDMFKRVQILELIMDTKYDELRTVKVKFIDDGKIDDVRPTVLVKLPDELASIPATSVDIFLCNVLPVDRDIEWGDIISNKVRERIQTLQESEDVLFIGEIQLVSGRDVWINPLQCHKIYDKGRDVIVIISSMCKDLLKKKVAVSNLEHLPKLLSMYESAGFAKRPKIVLDPVPESNKNSETVSTPSQSNNSAENVLNESSSSNSSVDTVVSSKPEQKTNLNKRPIHKDNSSNTYESEEEWVLEDEPQTLAAPVEKVEESYVPEDKESEEDLYAYENDAMLSNDLNEEFDCYFGPNVLDSLIETIYPGFTMYKEALDKMQAANNNVAPKIHRSAIQLPTNNELPAICSKPATTQRSVPRVSHYPVIEEQDGTTKRIFKPRIQWYQDTEFVYMQVELNVDEHVVRFDSDKLYFSASDHERLYEFNESLYTTIDECTAKSYKSGVQIVIKMEKLIKRNKWPRVFKNKDTALWVKKSIEHLDEDLEVPDAGWSERLNTGLALQEPQVPSDFSIIHNTDNVVIYPEGYEDLETYSEDEDSDGIGNDD